MKHTIPFIALFIMTSIGCVAQKETSESMNTNPYNEIPEAPETYNAATVLARSIDGLGYRFYWATDSLSDNDLDYDPGNDNKSTRVLIDHLVGLSETILNTVMGEPNIRPYAEVTGNFEEKRSSVLANLKQASDKLRTMTDRDIEDGELIFKRGEKEFKYPLWNLINGPISDAIYHTGQIVSYRRSSGNPINSKVNVFTGKNKKD